MKVLAVISLFLVYVAARGSGPYLPSGWKPDGPAFNLPSEVSKPLNEPLKDAIFSESEASGSDFLREYGPPKVQEGTQDVLQQGLPDVVNEQLFIEAVVDINDAKENSNEETEVTEEKVEVNAEIKAIEEAVPITEFQSDTVTESVLNVEEEAVQVNDETTTFANSVVSVEAVDEIGYIVEPTIAIIAPTEIVTIEVSAQSENQIIGDSVIETEQITSQQQESDQLIRQVEESPIMNTIQITSDVEEPTSEVSEQTEPSTEETIGTNVKQQAEANFDVISTVQESVQAVEEEVKSAENVVQNIPELIVSLENEVKSQEAETIQDVPAVPEIFGSLDQAPEGFLEYGPPGFREYGPPKEDLRGNTIEEKIPETQSIENSDIRRRRFSPKFRPSPKSN